MKTPKLKPCPFCGGTDFEICICRVPLCACKHEKTGIQADVCCKPCFYKHGVFVSVHTRHATDRKPKESWARCEARARSEAVVAWNRRADTVAKLAEPYNFSLLCDWYIHSVTGNPVWTEAHIRELLKDFYLIPKGDLP